MPTPQTRAARRAPVRPKSPPRLLATRTRSSTRVDAGYHVLFGNVVELIEAARSAAVRSVNTLMTATYWAIGRRLVEAEQQGRTRAPYGEAVIERLAVDLTAHFGRGFGARNLAQMRAFYLAYRDKVQTPSARSGARGASKNLQTPSAKSGARGASRNLQTMSAEFSLAEIAGCFPLPWSHYVRLVGLESPEARAFYEVEALRSGWTVRQLDRQISTQFYERTALSKRKANMLRRGEQREASDAVSLEEQIKDPFILEFLGLKDEYSESDLEEALTRRLETFLLELGGDFAFVGRQRRLRVGDEWYRVDLVFYHRRLRCLVLIDLKLGRFTHADAGQMHLYLNYAGEHWALSGENPPVGIILCAQKDAAVARYSLEGLSNKVLAAEYRTVLPNERLLAEEVDRTRRLLESRVGLVGRDAKPRGAARRAGAMVVAHAARH